MKNFLKDKTMWDYVDGTFAKPQHEQNAKPAKELETWEVNNSTIITWTNNYISKSIGMQLVKYDLAKAIWDHLKMLYVQSNFPIQYVWTLG